MLNPTVIEKIWPLFRSDCLRVFGKENNVTEERFKQFATFAYWEFFLEEYLDYLRDIPGKSFPKWVFLNEDLNDFKVSFKQWLFTERDYYNQMKIHDID